MIHCVVSAGATRLLAGVGFGDGNADKAAIDVGVAELRFTKPTSASVPVLTDQRSVPHPIGVGLGFGQVSGVGDAVGVGLQIGVGPGMAFDGAKATPRKAVFEFPFASVTMLPVIGAL